MSNQQNGPPEVGGRVSRTAGTEPANPANLTSDLDSADTRHITGDEAKTPGKALVWLPCSWSSPQDVPSQLARRRDTAKRSLPCDCGCRDPWLCRCTEPPLSKKMLDAAVAAIEHLDELGTPGLLEIDTCRAIWPRHRELAVDCARRAGWAAA